MSENQGQACPDEDLQAAAQLASADPGAGAAAIDRLLAVYPADARLHFIRGSLLAGGGRYADAIAAMQAAVDIAPGYSLARFQLGMLRLTSGDPVGSTEAWGPLSLLAADHPLRLFAEGLQALARDEFELVRTRLEAGIAANLENEPLNNDMRLILSQLPQGDAPAPDQPESSAVDWLLRQTDRRTRH